MIYTWHLMLLVPAAQLSMRYTSPSGNCTRVFYDIIECCLAYTLSRTVWNKKQKILILITHCKFCIISPVELFSSRLHNLSNVFETSHLP
ncbi:hypothetical protein BDF19DRAFT_453981 [Syncephalis fuscata]|nr:hypothetical protein BDF19DRAFT_453981 [Syncephalis fuscata]